MTLLEKIQFVLENTSAVSARVLVNNTDQNTEICNIESRLLEGTVYTTLSAEAAAKAALIVAINNGTI